MNSVNENKHEKGDESNESYSPDTIDTVITDLGGCGRFQCLLVVFGCFPHMAAAWTAIFMAYGGYNPGWTCNVTLTNSTLGLLSQGELNTSATTSSSSCQEIKQCHNVIFSSKASTIVSEWKLICSDAWVVPVISSIQMAGMALGCFVGGQVGAKFGRKFCICISAALISLTNVLALLSNSWKMYAAFRFLIGFSSGGIFTSIIVYVSEFLPCRWRGFLSTFIFWNIYTCLFSLITMALKSWRNIHIVTSVVSFLSCLSLLASPESIRFLTIQDKLPKARKAVRFIARINRQPVPDITIMEAVAKREKEIMKDQSLYSFHQLLGPIIRRYTFVMGLTWFMLSAGSYMVGFGLRALSGNFFINLLLYTALPVPVRFITLVLVAKVGRKFSCCLFVLLSACCSLLVVGIQFLALEDIKNTLTLILALGVQVGSEAAWGPAVVLSVELVPTGLRNLFLGFVNGFARIGAVLAPFLLSRDSLPLFGSFLILGSMQFICFVSLLTLPETLGQPLQDNLIKRKNRYKDNEAEVIS